MKILPIHTEALRYFGYTEEEAQFPYLVATHSGYFTCQQFLQFIETKPGKRSVAFARKVVEKKHASAKEFFTALSTVAPQYPSVESDLKSLLSSNSALARTAPGLSFIAKTSPRSPLLLEHCLSALSERNPGYNWVDHVETAAALVAEHFSHREDVGKKLVDLMNQFGLVGPLIAVCLVWPSVPILDELYANFTDPRFRSLSELAESYVLYTKSGPREFLTRLDRDIALAAGNVYHHRGFLAPAMNRMKRDNVVASHVYDVLSTSSSANTRASYIRLIADTQGVGIDLARWCHSQIEKHKSAEQPEIGYDVLLPGYRSTVLCFMDALDRSVSPDAALQRFRATPEGDSGPSISVQ